MLTASPTLAVHCNGEVTVLGVEGATFYLDDRSGAGGAINHWFYMESNGVEGLQSGSEIVCLKDTIWCILYPPDPCDHPDPDTKIF